MSLLPLLFFMAGAPESGRLPTITIDPCVEVDADEVERLAAMELRTWRWRTAPEELEVLATCQEGTQELRLTHRVRGQVTVRSIELGERLVDDEEAKERELALAIVEMLRRADVDFAPEAPPPSSPPPAPPLPPPRTDDVVQPVPPPWSIELGAMGVGAGWGGGEVLLGVDAVGRARLGRWLIAELRLGGRKTRPVELESGTVDGHAVAGALGLSFDATPAVHQAGVSFGARLGVDWLRYATRDRGELEYDGGDGAVVSLAGTTTGFVALSGALGLTVDAAVGGALHSVVIRENGEVISGMRGVLFQGALGLGAHF